MSGARNTLVTGVDDLIGDGIEAVVSAKHRWRLRRLGSEHALSPPDDGLWASGDPSPREGCSLDVLIDGAEAFPVIAEAIEGARDFIHVTGWHLAPHFDLVRDERPGTLGPMLAEAAQRLDVRVLVWAGAPVPAFKPTRRQVRDEHPLQPLADGLVDAFQIHPGTRTHLPARPTRVLRPSSRGG